MTGRSPAREAIPRFFAEPPPISPPDLGIEIRFRGRPYFLEAGRVVEIIAAPPVSRLPAAGRARGVAFWRGRAHLVVGEATEATLYLVLIRRAESSLFCAVQDTPRLVSRAGKSPAAENFPEDPWTISI
jgi:hypothetical protein